MIIHILNYCDIVKQLSSAIFRNNYANNLKKKLLKLTLDSGKTYTKVYKDCFREILTIFLNHVLTVKRTEMDT